MFQFWFKGIILWHAGTSPVVSQTVLTLMLVVLGIVLVGIGFVYLVKTKESLLEHRWMLSGSIALTAGAILLVILPTFFRFYLDPDVQVFSGLSDNHTDPWTRGRASHYSRGFLRAWQVA
jgi:hypothetical protein